MGRQKALEARLHAFEIQAVVVDGVQQLVELGGVAGLVLFGRDAIAEIEVLNAADGERRFHSGDHEGKDGQLTGAGAGEFVEAVAVGAAYRVRGQQHEEFAVGDGDLVEGVVHLAFPVGAGGEAGFGRTRLRGCGVRGRISGGGRGGVGVVSVAQEEAHGVYSSSTREYTRPAPSPATMRWSSANAQECAGASQ